jgi:PKD domain
MRFFWMILVLAATACTQPPKPTANTAPVSSFSAPSSAVAGQVVLFDGTGSSDADADPLTHSWDFGNGVRGGTPKLGQVFAEAGTFAVQLTVTDTKGSSNSSQKTIVVAPAPAPNKTVSVNAVVRDSSQNALAGVLLESGISQATTDSTGKATLNGIGAGNNASVTVRLSKTGFSQQIKLLELPQAAESGYFEAVLMPQEAAQTLPDAAAGGTLAGKDGAKLVLPQNALQTASGAPVTGAVQVNLSPVDVDNNVAAFPGEFEGVGSDGQTGLIMSYGTVEFALSQNGQEVNLAPGKMADIEIPIYTSLNKDGSAVKVGDTYPLWSLNEQTGGWIQEGRGTVVSSSSTPTGLALRGQVAHFSWWNHDDFAGPSYKPKPKCLVDTNADGVLEDLTGTGHCWHAGTGPEQPDDGFGAAPANLHPQNVVPRIPAFVAEDTTPAIGGKILEMPADLNITVRSSALNGTLAATTVFRGAANIEEDVVVVLKPVAGGAQDVPITIPWNQPYSLSAANETDRFTFTGVAGQVYGFNVARNGSSVNATVRLLKNGVQISSASLGNTPAVLYLLGENTNYTLEVVGGSSTGGYALQATQETLAVLPFFTELVNTGNLLCPNGSNTSFVRANAGEDLVVRLATRTGNTPNSGTLKLFTASGSSPLLSDSFTTPNDSAEGGFLVYPVTQTGLYRIESTWKSYCEVRLSVNTAQPVALNSNTTLGALSNAHETRTLRLTGDAGMVVNAGAAQDGNNQDFAVELYSADGTRLGTSYRANSVQNKAYLEPLELPSTGNYYVVVRSVVGAVSNVRVGVSQLVLEPWAGGSTQNGSIETIGGIRYYSLNLNQGDVGRLLPRSTAANTFVSSNVFLPSSEVFFKRPKALQNNIASNASTPASTVTIKTTGQHVFEVRGVFGTQARLTTGAFSLEWQSPSPVALALDGWSSTSIPAFGIGVFSFEVTSAGFYNLYISAPNGVFGDSSLLVEPNGTTRSLDVPQNLPVGSYTLVHSSSRSTAQSVTAFSAGIENPVPLTLGNSVAANLTVRERDYYSFAGTQGQALKLSIGALGGSATSTVQIYRLDAGGDFTKLPNNPTTVAGGTTPINYTPTSTGTFMVSVRNDQNVSGEYTVLLETP